MLLLRTTRYVLKFREGSVIASYIIHRAEWLSLVLRSLCFVLDKEVGVKRESRKRKKKPFLLLLVDHETEKKEQKNDLSVV